MADMSIFSILNTGVLGTYTAKLAMSITAHNIANANTPGYSRQRPDIHATPPIPMSSLTQANVPMMLGTGSMVKRVERVRDEFMDVQYREVTRNLAFWDKTSSNLHYMEQLIDEPSENGFRKYFDDLWNSFDEVMDDPLNPATIAQVKGNTENFVRVFKDIYGRFEELRNNLNEDIKGTTLKVNDLLKEIGQLNGKIRTSYIINTEPNDLLDERDRLLDQLNEYVGATYKKGEGGHLEVYIGQQIVVNGDYSTEIDTAVRPNTINIHDLFIRGSKINVKGGQLSSLIQLRDETIPKYLDRYDELALMMTDKLNLVHRAGFDLNGTVTGIDLLKQLDAVRSDLPNVFRMMGNNSISGGPIHMAVSTSTSSPSTSTLGKTGNVSLVSLSNNLNNSASTTESFPAHLTFQEVIEKLNSLEFYDTLAEDKIYDSLTGNLSLEDFSTYSDKSEIYYVFEETLSQSGTNQFKISDLVDINSDGNMDQNDIVIQEGGIGITGFDYDIDTGMIKITDPAYTGGNITVRRWTSENVDVLSGGIDTTALSKTAVNLSFGASPDENDFMVRIKGLRADAMTTTDGKYKMILGSVEDDAGSIDHSKANSLGNLRDVIMIDQDGILSKMGFKTKSQKFLEIAEYDGEDTREITLNVPQRNEQGKWSNVPYTISFNSRDELVTKLNNNSELNEYVKAFEHEGKFYLTVKETVEGIENIVTKDEFNMLSDTTLQVLDNDAYQNLSNIMYDYSEAAKSNYTFSNIAGNQIDLNLKSNLNEYNGKVKVKYSTIDDNGGAGYTVSAFGTKYRVNLGGFEVKDRNSDGKIDKQDLKIIDRATSTLMNFSYDQNNNAIILDSNPGNVDVLYWKEEVFNLNGAAGNTYTLNLESAPVNFENPANPANPSTDFLLDVQLPPDEITLNLGTTDIDIDVNNDDLSDVVETINKKAPSGIIADLTPDNKLVFRAGRSVDFSFGKRLEDGRVVQTYSLNAPIAFWEKLGFIKSGTAYGNTWGLDVDVVRNYIDTRSYLHNYSVSDNLDIDTRQSDGILGYVKRLQLSSQISSNPMLLAVDYGKWSDLNGDWIADLHEPRGSSNMSLNSIQNLLSEAKYSTLLDDGRTSFSDYLGTFVSEMGIESQTAIRMKNNNQTIQIQIDNERERVKGVSLDEEMSNMIKYQQAFNASARVVTAVDQMIQRIIDGLGMAGR